MGVSDPRDHLAYAREQHDLAHQQLDARYDFNPHEESVADDLARRTLDSLTSIAHSLAAITALLLDAKENE